MSVSGGSCSAVELLILTFTEETMDGVMEFVQSVRIPQDVCRYTREVIGGNIGWGLVRKNTFAGYQKTRGHFQENGEG